MQLTKYIIEYLIFNNINNILLNISNKYHYYY